MEDVLIVIPARGGSKGIPMKNIRFFADKPLLYYSISLAKKFGADFVVSTESTYIKEVARIFDAPVIDRPSSLAGDEVTLDDVIIHAVKEREKERKRKYKIVVTLQPTSPLLSYATLKAALEEFLKKGCDTLISCRERRHLFWIKKGEELVPFYSERKNRQFLEPIFEETGAFVICSREVLEKGSRFGERISIFVMDDFEAIDIDDWVDWVAAEAVKKRLKIVLHTNGSRSMGLGHVYRCLTLANKLIQHGVIFVMDGGMELGVEKVKEHNFEVKTYSNEEDFFEIVSKIKPHIIINDVLDTTASFIKRQKSLNAFIVNFEDLGEGSLEADLLFNALYEWSSPSENRFFGYKYECLREDFYLFPIKKSTPRKVENILLSFGGADQNNLTARVLKILKELQLKEVLINVVLGLGYNFRQELNVLVDEMDKKGFKVGVIDNTSLMPKYIYQADILITSNGRTVYEGASLGVPTISISQNQRELTHLFSRICEGVIDLGLATEISDQKIKEAILRAVNDYSYRSEMVKNIIPYAREIRKGLERVVTIILERHFERVNGG
jgi:CMP-N-acetylneuraminic acid synthetase